MIRKQVKKVKTLKEVERLAAQIRKKRRQYYLHRCVKRFTRMDRRQKTIFIAPAAALTNTQRKHLNELVSAFHYAIQTEIE